MANVSYGVNIIPKNNTLTIGNSQNPWTIVSPSLTGTPTAPTASTGTSTQQVATTAFVAAAIASVGGLPAVSSTDNGKVLRVVDGAWAVASIPVATGGSF